MASSADPHKAVFIVFTPRPLDPSPTAPRRTPGTTGHVGWRELHAGEREAAFAFHADLFGWTKTEAIDFGPIGVCQTFSTGALPAPTWLVA